MHGNRIFMEKAIALAIENVTSGRGDPFGAVIVRGSEIVATGANLVTATNDPTAHCGAIFYGCSSADAAAMDFDDAFLYQEMKRPIGDRRIPAVNLLHNEALTIFDARRLQAARIDH